jgi:hypothetical protein
VVAAACLLALTPTRPVARLPWPTASILGAGCGLLLFGLLVRARPRLPVRGRWPVVAGRLAVFALWAADEEVVWRRVALGELLRAGAVPAILASTVGFALLHRARPVVHLGTGGAFGVLYFSTGALAASIAAHWTYNVLVAALVQRRRT